jgi:hypothetical protein
METVQGNAMINPNKVDFPNILKVFKPDPQENPDYADAGYTGRVLIDIVDYIEPEKGQVFFYNFVQKNVEIVQVMERRSAKGDWPGEVPTWFRCLAVVR